MGRGRRKTPTASRESCIMELTNKPRTRKIDAMSKRRHAIRQDAWKRLTDHRREILGTAWNQYVNRCARTSPRHFARVHGREFLSQKRLDRAFKSEVYYTRAYASYEKGALQPPRQEMVPEGNRLQPAHKTADPAARGLHKLNPQGIAQRRDRICLRFTSGQSGLRGFC